MSRFYYLFGFLALVLVILLITCAEISIALTYFQLTWLREKLLKHGRSDLINIVKIYIILYYIILYYTAPDTISI